MRNLRHTEQGIGKCRKVKIILLKFLAEHTLCTVNDVTGKDPLQRPQGVFTSSVGAFHLERPLKIVN